MAQVIINAQQPVQPTGMAPDRKHIAEARLAVIVCFSWIILAPFAIWFGVSHVQNFWLGIVPLVFGCIAVIPLMGSYTLVVEYRAALRGEYSE